jgi:hypothetical protein
MIYCLEGSYIYIGVALLKTLEQGVALGVSGQTVRGGGTGKP